MAASCWLLPTARPKPFRSKHFHRRAKYRPLYLELAAILVDELDFDSAIDVGCGNGFLLEGFLEAGKSVRGVDSAPGALEVMPGSVTETVTIADFSAVEGISDLVTCVEVAEHLVPERSESLIETLTGSASRWIYFTAAPPGQPGRGHINCREPQDWLDWFAGRGWELDPEKTTVVKRRLSPFAQAPWLSRNSMVLGPAG